MVMKEFAVPLKQIDQLFEAYHDQLTNQLRYARFLQGESKDQYIDLLGPDVVGATHPKLTAEITDCFIAHNETHGLLLTLQEQLLLRTAPHVHDLGELTIESLGVGDVSFDQKSHADSEVEHQVFLKVLERVPTGPDKDLMREAYINVAMDKSSRLGRMFNAIERIGYLETAIRAFEGMNGKRINNWRGLAGNVLSNQIETLLTYRGDYPYVDFILQKHAKVISLMFAEIGPYPVPHDAEGKLSYDLPKFDRAQQLWHNRETEAPSLQ